ncbi:MAG: condensation domain-containing protein, partial [Chloroflexota bacterium]
MTKSSPMNEAQKDVWTAIQFDPTLSLNYNLAIGIHLEGNIDVEALETAVSLLIERHGALRAVPNADGVSQRIFDSIKLPFEALDYQTLSTQSQNDALEKHRLEEVNSYFDLDNGPLCRFKCLTFSETKHLVLISCHHIISDGWSMGVLASNLGALYTAVCQNRTPELGELMQLGAFNAHLETAVGSEAYQEAENYWLEQFADIIPVLDLPTDRNRPARKTPKGLQIDVPISESLISQLQKAAREQRTTLYSYLLAGFHLLLHRFSGQKQIVVGIPVAGQLSVDAEDLVGHCVNFLPIRLDFDQPMTFPELLGEAKNQLFEGIAQQSYPSGQLIKKLPIKRDSSRLPLISVAFNQFPSRLIDSFDGLKATFEVLPRHYELFDIFMNVIEGPTGFKIQCTASQDLFDRATIQRMMRSYLNLLACSVEAKDKKVSRLSLLSKSQREKMVVQWNQTEMAYNPTATLHSMFSTRAEQFAEKTAVISPYGSLTYAELELRSNKLANHLQKMGVQSNQFVGICLQRTPDLIVGLLGILKAGGAYLPMDPNYPEERLKFMLEDSQANILLAETETINELPQFLGRTILIDKDWSDIDSANTPPIQYRHNNMSDALAYTIFTSGSTGKPKGVKITHRNVVNFLITMQKEPGIRSTDVLMAVTTLSFDIAVLELFLPLVSGATVALADVEMSRDGRRLANGLKRMNVSIMQATPATWQMLLAAGWQPAEGFKMLSGGEP